MISQHVMRMPAIRHQLQLEAANAARQNAVSQAQIENDKAEAENHRASSRKGNAEAALSEDELAAAKEMQDVLSQPDAMQTNADGSVTISAGATGNLLATLARAGTRGSAFGSASRNVLTARNAPFEADANRQAADDRNTYSVDQREQTRRDAPVAVPDNSRLVTRAGDAIGGMGLHRLGPDQTLLGDVPGPELNRLAVLGVGTPKPTTPQGDSNLQRFKAGVIMKKASGELSPDQAAAALAEYTGTPVKTAAPGYKIGARYKGGLVYQGGDPNDQTSWQQAVAAPPAN